MINRLKGFLYNIIEFFATQGSRKTNTSKKILLLRVDEIGDYILFRSFIKPILETNICVNATIHFCGNTSWQQLFELEFGNSFSKVYWLQKNNFKSKILYRYSFLKSIYKENYSTVINPTFSRAKRVDDAIVKAAKAINNIGMKRNNENYEVYENNFDKSLYQSIFQPKEKLLFEFERNKLFAENITNTNINASLQFNNELIQKHEVKDLPENFAVIFPGSRNKYRIWPTENFVTVSNYLVETHQLKIIVCGSMTDAVYAESFIQQCPFTVINLVGKTNLLQMLYILSKAKCLLSVDTGSIHLAASVNCTTFGIFNGSQYGRFSPYPKTIIKNIYAVYPDEVETDIIKNNLNKYEYVVNIPYAAVDAKKIISVIKHHFNLQHEI